MYRSIAALVGAVVVTAALLPAPPDRSRTADDESVFVKGLAPDEHESLLYVWTRDGDGRESDFLAVVDADPESASYGQVIATEPAGSAGNEAHHFGYTVGTDRIFAGGLFSNQLFIYDVERDPRSPELIRTVDLDPTGYSGPHTLYAVPGGVMIAMLGAPDGGGPGGLVTLNDDGELVTAVPQAGHPGVPEYMYDVGVKPEMDRMITSSWAHPQHVKMAGGSPPDETGSQVVVWSWKDREILQVVELDKAPLEVRWLHGPDGRGGFINCAYGGTVWHWHDGDGDGELQFERVIELPQGAAPADMRISYDNRFLYVSNFGAGSVQQYDISDPLSPRLVDEVALAHPNMMKLSPDSERLYVTNSLLSTMDPDENFKVWLLHVGPDGMRVDDDFDPDFMSFASGPAGPHDMLLK
jgi:selenium-binding protein 1